MFFYYLDPCSWTLETLEQKFIPLQSGILGSFIAEYKNTHKQEGCTSFNSSFQNTQLDILKMKYIFLKKTAMFDEKIYKQHYVLQNYLIKRKVKTQNTLTKTSISKEIVIAIRNVVCTCNIISVIKYHKNVCKFHV